MWASSFFFVLGLEGFGCGLFGSGFVRAFGGLGSSSWGCSLSVSLLQGRIGFYFGRCSGVFQRLYQQGLKVQGAASTLSERAWPEPLRAFTGVAAPFWLLEIVCCDGCTELLASEALIAMSTSLQIGLRLLASAIPKGESLPC